MHGIPGGFDASRLVGASLEVVAFSENNIHFSFDARRSITIEGSFVHAGSRSASAEVSTEADSETVPVLNSRLMQLVGSSIVSANAQTDGGLALEFSNGQSLRIYDHPQYEAYRITIDDEETIV